MPPLEYCYIEGKLYVLPSPKWATSFGALKTNTSVNPTIPNPYPKPLESTNRGAIMGLRCSWVATNQWLFAGGFGDMRAYEALSRLITPC